MTCRMPTTSEQFVPEKRLPQAGARDAEVPSLQAGSCARTTGQGVACPGHAILLQPTHHGQEFVFKCPPGILLPSLSEKTQPNKKFATAFPGSGWVSQGLLRGPSPPKFGVKASPCSNKIGEGNKVVLPTALSWGHRGCPAVVPGHGWKMLPTSGKGKGLSPLPTSFSSDLCVPQKGLLISQCW